MNEMFKVKIIDFLKKNKDKIITPRRLSIELGISYPTMLKACELLEAEGKLKSQRVGNIKAMEIVQ